MNIDRRGFIAGATASVLCGCETADGGCGRFSFAHATDLHSSETDIGALKIPHKFEGQSFVDDINALKPTFAILTGDLISDTTMDPRCWATSEEYWRRYRRIVTDRLCVPWHQIIGNNDCAEIPYRKVFPDCPVRWTFDCGGIRFVGLHGYDVWKVGNTNHAGILYGPEQLAWLEDLVADFGGETLVLFTHEPLQDSDSHRVRRQLAPILAKFRGRFIWNICGHNHWNSDAIIQIGSREVRVVQTMTPVGEWEVGDGCYRIFDAQGGRIVSSSLRWLTKEGSPIATDVSPRWRNPPLVKMIEETLSLGALQIKLWGKSPVDLVSGGCFEDRLSNCCLPHRTGLLKWRIPSCVDGVPVRKIKLAILSRLEGTFAMEDAIGRREALHVVLAEPDSTLTVPSGFSGTITCALRNDSNYDFRLLGYALLA